MEETTLDEVLTGTTDVGVVVELSARAGQSDDTLLLVTGSCFFKAAACETRARSAGLMADSVLVPERHAVHGSELRQESAETIPHCKLNDLELFAVKKLRLIDED